MVSTNTCSPTTSEPWWALWRPTARRSRSARSVSGPPSVAAVSSAAARRIDVRFSRARTSTQYTPPWDTFQLPKRASASAAAMVHGPWVGCSTA